MAVVIGPYIELPRRRGRRRELRVMRTDADGSVRWSLSEYDERNSLLHTTPVRRMRLQLLLGVGERRRRARSLEQAERAGILY